MKAFFPYLLSSLLALGYPANGRPPLQTPVDWDAQIELTLDSIRSITDVNLQETLISNLSHPLGLRTVDTIYGRQFFKRLHETDLGPNTLRLKAFAKWQEAVWIRAQTDDREAMQKVLEDGLALTDAHDLYIEKADILLELGRLHWNFDDRYLEPTVEYFLRAEDHLKKYGAENFVRGTDIMMAIGDYYYRMGYNDRALHFLKVVPGLNNMRNDFHKANFLNTAGLAYEKAGKYDSAMICYLKCLQVARHSEDTMWHSAPLWEGIVSENIGSVYYKLNMPDQAIPFLENGVKRCKDNHLVYHCAAGSAKTLGRIYFEKEQLEKSEMYFNLALQLDKKSPKPATTRDIYQGLYKLNVKFGRKNEALMYHVKFTRLLDSLHSSDQVVQVKRKELLYGFEKKEQARLQRIEMLEQEKRIIRSRQITTATVGVLCLIIVTILYIFQRQRSVHKRKLLEQEMERQGIDLKHHVEKLIQKTNLVEHLQQQLDRIRIEGGEQKDEQTELISMLLHSSLLTDADWQEFKRTFDMAHRGYLASFKEKYPDLTEGELRLLTLLKLNLSSKEMAQMLGISLESVHKSRYRLRKKLNLPAEEELKSVIHYQ